jgi:hypothetical protein
MAQKKSYNVRSKKRTTLRRTTRSKKFGRRGTSNRRILAPRTLRQFSRLSAQAQDQWTRLTQAITKIRNDRVSVREASREFDLDPKIVIRLGRSALRKRKNGQYIAKPTDKLLRILAVPTLKGTREVALRNSQQASLLGEYWNAVQRYLQTGVTTELEKFKRKRIISADGKRIRLITDPEQLSQLGHAGVLSFESLYAGVSR